MQCKCGNEARYINERSELCCGICPIKEGIESIRISDVGMLLQYLRCAVAEDSRWPLDRVRTLLGRKP